jgi:hypothetical protein
MRAAFAGLLLLAMVCPSMAQGQTTCPSNGRTAPKVTIIMDPATVSYRNDLTQAQLTELSSKQRRTNYGGNRKMITVGLTRAEGGYEVRSSSQIYPLRNKTQYCGWLSSVEVRLYFKSMLVNVASDYRPGSCEYTAVIDHENKHVAIYRRNMDVYARRVKAELERAVARFGPASASSQQGVAQQFMNEAGRYIKPLLDEMHDQAERDHANLDSPESYKYSQGLCKGWKM